MLRESIKNRIVRPLFLALQQGLGWRELAITLAVGVVAATFPIFGITTLLCVFIAAQMRLNQVAIQLANYLGYPLQFILFIPMIRLGESLFGLQPVSIHLDAVYDLLWHHPYQFLEQYGVALGAACVVWLMAAIPAFWLLNKLSLTFIPVESSVESSVKKSADDDAE